jgi:hypothetical protein
MTVELTQQLLGIALAPAISDAAAVRHARPSRAFNQRSGFGRPAIAVCS